MKKFKVTVTRTDEYEIEVDESIWTPQELRTWGESFHKVLTPLHFAYCLGEKMSIIGPGYIWGFGYVQTFDKDGKEIKQFEGVNSMVPDDRYTDGVRVKIISFANNISTKAKELNAIDTINNMLFSVDGNEPVTAKEFIKTNVSDDSVNPLAPGDILAILSLKVDQTYDPIMGAPVKRIR